MLAQTELVFGMLCAAETNDRMQALQEQAMPLLAAHRDKIRLDDKLFVRVKEVYDRRAALGLDAEQMRLLQKPTTPSCVPGRCSTPSRRPA